MLKKTIAYKDLDDVQHVEDFYFHLSKAELAEMALAEEDLADKLKAIVTSENKAEIIKAFKDIIKRSVGVRSEDGKRFIKDPEAAEDFMQSEAFGELFMELFTDAKAAAEFISKVVPIDLTEKLQAQFPDVLEGRQITGITDVQLPEEEPEKKYTFDDFSDDELLEMSDTNFNQLMGSLKGKNVPKRILVISQKRKNNQ